MLLYHPLHRCWRRWHQQLAHPADWLHRRQQQREGPLSALWQSHWGQPWQVQAAVADAAVARYLQQSQHGQHWQPHVVAAFVPQQPRQSQQPQLLAAAGPLQLPAVMCWQPQVSGGPLQSDSALQRLPVLPEAVSLVWCRAQAGLRQLALRRSWPSAVSPVLHSGALPFSRCILRLGRCTASSCAHFALSANSRQRR